MRGGFYRPPIFFSNFTIFLFPGRRLEQPPYCSKANSSRSDLATDARGWHIWVHGNFDAVARFRGASWTRDLPPTA